MSSLWQTIQSQVEEFVKRIGLAGLALANEDGLLIASSGYGVDAELVAAVSPLHGDQNDMSLRQIREDLQESGLELEIVDVRRGTQSLFLCATGQKGASNGAELKSFLQELSEKLV